MKISFLFAFIVSLAFVISVRSDGGKNIETLVLLDNQVIKETHSQFFKFLPGEQRQAFLHEVTEKAT